MSITLKQSIESTVNPVDDARLYELYTESAVGFINPIEINHTGGNQLLISAGWGIIKGRQFEINSETILVKLSPAGTKKGRLLININLAAETVISIDTQVADTLPELVQENINVDGNIYQYELATYNVNEISLSDLAVTYTTTDFKKIYAPKDKSISLEKIADNIIAENFINTYTQSGSTFLGSGINGKVKINETLTAQAILIDAEAYTVRCGEMSEIELLNGRWYSFTLDETNKTINFKTQGNTKSVVVAKGTDPATVDVSTGTIIFILK